MKFVRCITTDELDGPRHFMEENPLTVGKRYEVVSTNLYSIRVKGDNGFLCDYFAKRFIYCDNKLNNNIKIL
jgi:hypothetical protein